MAEPFLRKPRVWTVFVAFAVYWPVLILAMRANPGMNQAEMAKVIVAMAQRPALLAGSIAASALYMLLAACAEPSATPRRLRSCSA